MNKLIKLASFSVLAMSTFSLFVPLAQAEEVQALVVDNGSGRATIPEPETLALLAAGLAGIVLVRRKKKSK